MATQVELSDTPVSPFSSTTSLGRQGIFILIELSSNVASSTCHLYVLYFPAQNFWLIAESALKVDGERWMYGL